MSIKEELIKYLEKSNKDIPENVLTTGRLIISLLDFKTTTPVKIMSGSEELRVCYAGVSPIDENAWAGDIEMPNRASMYEIQVQKFEENLNQ